MERAIRSCVSECVTQWETLDSDHSRANIQAAQERGAWGNSLCWAPIAVWQSLLHDCTHTNTLSFKPVELLHPTTADVFSHVLTNRRIALLITVLHVNLARKIGTNSYKIVRSFKEHAVSSDKLIHIHKNLFKKREKKVSERHEMVNLCEVQRKLFSSDTKEKAR